MTSCMIGPHPDNAVEFHARRAADPKRLDCHQSQVRAERSEGKIHAKPEREPLSLARLSRTRVYVFIITKNMLVRSPP